MKRLGDIDFQRAYGDVPESFARRVTHTLSHIEKEEQPMRRFTLRTAILCAILLALTATALAAAINLTAQWFGAFYGEDVQHRLEQGAVAPGGQSHQLGDVVFTLNEVIAVEETCLIPLRDESGDVITDADGNPQTEEVLSTVLYATGVFSPAQGAKLVLMAEDCAPEDPWGYDPYSGEPRPSDVPTYLEKARETDARLMRVRAVGDFLTPEGGERLYGAMGYAMMPQADGTIRVTLEFQPDPPMDPAPSYELGIWLSADTVAVEGSGDDAPDASRLGETWTLTVTPSRPR